MEDLDTSVSSTAAAYLSSNPDQDSHTYSGDTTQVSAFRRQRGSEQQNPVRTSGNQTWSITIPEGFDPESDHDDQVVVAFSHPRMQEEDDSESVEEDKSKDDEEETDTDRDMESDGFQRQHISNSTRRQQWGDSTRISIHGTWRD